MTSVRIIEDENQLLHYVHTDEDKASPEDKTFVRFMSHYDVARAGSTISVRHKVTKQLATQFEVADNTQFTSDLEVSPQFGAKRFFVGALMQHMEEKHAEDFKAIRFARDISFPLTTAVSTNSDNSIDVASYRKFCLSEKEVYENIAELFHRCADFTPGKQDEYLSGGKLENIYCRFNNENYSDDNEALMDHVMLRDGDTGLLGTISISCMVNPKGLVNLYFKDEVADYYKKLSTDKRAELKECIRELQELEATKSEDSASHTTKVESVRRKINTISNDARKEIFSKLFPLATLRAREMVCKKLNIKQDELDKRIASGEVRGFIRAAAGREQLYRELGCDTDRNQVSFVIHGAPTVYAKLTDAHIKSWAQNKINAMVRLTSMLNAQRSYEASASMNVVASNDTTVAVSKPTPQGGMI